MAEDRLPARFSLRSQVWFRGTGNCFETATSHMQSVLMKPPFFKNVTTSGEGVECICIPFNTKKPLKLVSAAFTEFYFAFRLVIKQLVRSFFTNVRTFTHLSEHLLQATHNLLNPINLYTRASSAYVLPFSCTCSPTFLPASNLASGATGEITIYDWPPRLTCPRLTEK